MENEVKKLPKFKHLVVCLSNPSNFRKMPISTCTKNFQLKMNLLPAIPFS